MFKLFRHRKNVNKQYNELITLQKSIQEEINELKDLQSLIQTNMDELEETIKTAKDYLTLCGYSEAWLEQTIQKLRIKRNFTVIK